MKKIAVGIVLSLFIGGALVEAGTTITNHVIESIDQSINNTINSMFADIY